MNTSYLLVAVVLVFAQCGDSMNQTYQPDRPLTGNCRRYASRYAVGGTVYNCNFEPATLSIFCDDDSANPVMAYNTLTDFIDEPKVIGQLLRKTGKGPTYFFANMGTHTYSYDMQGQLIIHEALEWPTHGSLTYSEREAFNSWDAKGRPTMGNYSSGLKTSYCHGLTNWTYDDVNRQLTISLSMLQGSINICPPSISTTITYDASGIILSINSQLYDIQTTADVCN